MWLRSCLIAVIVFVGGVASSPFSGPSMECDFPTLAAESDIRVALSCVEGIVYDDTEYFVGCAPAHRSRVGDLFLHDGGDTRFTGAREVVGVPRSDVFLLETDTRRECKHTSS